MAIRFEAPEGWDDVVTMVLLAKRGLSARYIALCVSRIRGTEVSAADVERLVSERVEPVRGRSRRRSAR